MLLRVLFEHRAALEIPIRRIELEAAHPVGFEVHDGPDAIGRDDEVVVRELVLRLGVHLGAEPCGHVVDPGAEMSCVPRNIMCSSACASPVLPGSSSSAPKRYHMWTCATGAA